MKTYKGNLISKDGQKFEINVNAYSDDEAIQSGLDVVNTMGMRLSNALNRKFEFMGILTMFMSLNI